MKKFLFPVLLLLSGLPGAADAPQAVWADYRPGYGPKPAQVDFQVTDDALAMNFGANPKPIQAWGSKSYSFPGFGQKVRLTLSAKAVGVTDPAAWVQLSFQGSDATGKNIGAYELKHVPTAELTEWTPLSFDFRTPAATDPKWSRAAEIMSGFSARVQGSGTVLFRDVKYRELSASAITLKDFHPGKGPAGIKATATVVDDTIIAVKFLDGSIPGGMYWFFTYHALPAAGSTVKISVAVRALDVTDPKARVQLSIQGNDAKGRNINDYILKHTPAFELEEWTVLTHTFTIPAAGHAKWDRAAQLMTGFAAQSANGSFEFKDFNVTVSQ